MKPKLNKTESTFSKNESLNRSYEVRRDNDTIKRLSVSLYDIDYAIKWYIQNAIRPVINENDTLLTVPVMFSSGEKWAAAQRHGYLRDQKGMLQSPMIMIRRASVENRTDLDDNNVLRGIKDNTGNKVLFERKYSAANRYDRFSVNNKITPLKEFYAIDFPKFVNANYDLLCWTNHMEQLNDLVEQFLFHEGKAWGDTYKFITYVDSPAFEVVNDVGSERLVRAALSLRTNAYIVVDRTGNHSNIEKFYGVNKTLVATETEVTPEQLEETFAQRQARIMKLMSNATGNRVRTNQSLDPDNYT